MDQEKKEAIKKDIDFSRPESFAILGGTIEDKLSKGSEEILSRVRNRDTAEVGELLTEMISVVRQNPLPFLQESTPFGRIWNKFLKEVSLYRSGFERISDQLASMGRRLRLIQQELTADSLRLRVLYQENIETFEDLELLICACEEKLEEHRPSAEAASTDLLVQQSLKDQRHYRRQFEKRVHDLKLVRVMLLQTLPQIRLLEHNNQELIARIHSLLTHTVPIWKQQIILGIGQQKQREAASMQKKLLDTTNELLRKNSRTLKENTLEVARLADRGVIDRETLEAVNSELVATISETIAIYQEARVNRSETERSLVAMEKTLVASLGQVPLGPTL